MGFSLIVHLHERYRYRSLLEEHLAQGVVPRNFVIGKAGLTERLVCLALSIISAFSALISFYYYTVFKESWSTFYQGNKISLRKLDISGKFISLEEDPSFRPPLSSPVTSKGNGFTRMDSIAHEVSEHLWVAGSNTIDRMYDLFNERRSIDNTPIGLVLGYNTQWLQARRTINLSVYKDLSQMPEALSEWVSLVQEISQAIRAGEDVMILAGENEDTSSFLALSYLAWKEHEDLSKASALNGLIASLIQKRPTLTLSTSYQEVFQCYWGLFKERISLPSFTASARSYAQESPFGEFASEGVDSAVNELASKDRLAIYPREAFLGERDGVFFGKGRWDAEVISSIKEDTEVENTSHLRASSYGEPEVTRASYLPSFPPGLLTSTYRASSRDLSLKSCPPSLFKGQ